jgi:hypothetical protein
MFAILLVNTALASPAGLAVVPFGVSVYLHGRPGRGVAYSATQAVGFGFGIAGSVLATQAQLDSDEPAYRAWQGLAAAGVSLGVASFLVAAVDTSRLHELEQKRASVLDWDADRTWDAARARVVSEQPWGGER